MTGPTRTVLRALLLGWTGLAAAGVGGLHGPSGAAGQQVPVATATEPVRLTLDRAMDLALDGNPAYRRSLNLTDLNDPAGKAAWGSWLPELFLSASTGQNVSRRSVSEDVFGNPIDNPELLTNWTSNSSQSISVGMDLFRGRNLYGMRQARAESSGRDRGRETAWVSLFAEVERRYFDAQRLEEALELEENFLVDKERDLEVARRLYALATNSRADVLASELDLQRQERAVQEALGNYESALLSLRTVLGDTDLGEFELAKEPLDIFDPVQLDEDALVARALTSNPAILQDQAATEAGAAALSASRSDRWPTVRLSANLGGSELSADQGGLFGVFPTDQVNGSVSLSVNWPVFQRFATSYQIAQAEVSLRNSQETLRERRLEVERQVRDRIIQLESAYRTVILNRAALTLAEERLRLAREEYSLGTRSYEELQIAVAQRDTADRDLLTSQYEFVLSRINLEEALGGRLDLTPVRRDQENGRTPQAGPAGARAGGTGLS
jgi:outer membrane protein